MIRRYVWIGLAALAVAVLGSVWFLSNFERVSATRYEGARPEARRDPYLALERFLARMGRPPQVVSNAQALDSIAPGGVILLDDNRRRQIDAPRLERLRAWVEAGGYLIVNAESEGVDDPLLEGLGVSWRSSGAKECGPDQDAADMTEEEEAPAPPPRVEVRIPAVPQRLTLEAPSAGLRSDGPAPQWRVELPGKGDSVLHFTQGAGHVTVFADLLQIAGNRRIGRSDHAEFIWTLLQRYQARGPVTLAARLAVPTLGEWLLESAPMVLASAALLLAAWLGRIVPRFGGLAPPPPRERRSLGEHLAAMGRFVARAGGQGHWLATARAALHARLALRHPALAAMPPKEQEAALAKLSHLPGEELRFALRGAAASRNAFKNAVATLQKLEQLL